MATRDLFQEMENFRRSIDEAFRTVGIGPIIESGLVPGLGVQSAVRVNLSEDDDNMYIQALVPGIEPKDVDLNIMSGMLTLSGERKVEVPAGGTWHRRECGSGSFTRSVQLPVEADLEKVSAESRNGILRITLPKAESAKPKKITVRAD